MTSLQVEDLHAIGNDRLQNGYTACEGSKSRHQEKRKSHKASQAMHGIKDLGEGYKHQAGTCLHTLNSVEDKNRRNDH